MLGRPLGMQLISADRLGQLVLFLVVDGFANVADMRAILVR